MTEPLLQNWSVSMLPRFKSNRTYTIYWVLFYLYTLTPSCRALDPSASVTIDKYSDYEFQRSCGRGCLQNNYDGGADIEKALGCTWNDCYCGTQYQAAATSILTSCWSAYCGTSQLSLLSYDISTAISVYNAYCSGTEKRSSTTQIDCAGISSCLDPSASVSINKYPSYEYQRSCGRGCLQNDYDGGADITKALGCTCNGCYCGTQYKDVATSILSSCWSAYCGTSQLSLLSYDILTALSLYDAYCAGAQIGISTSGACNHYVQLYAFHHICLMVLIGQY
jgi:hypothetical protein